MKTPIPLLCALMILGGCQSTPHPKISDLAMNASPGNVKRINLFDRTKGAGSPNQSKEFATVEILGYEEDVVFVRLSSTTTSKTKDILITYKADFDCKQSLYRPTEGATTFKVNGPDGARTEAPLKFNGAWSAFDRGDELVEKAHPLICYSAKP